MSLPLKEMKQYLADTEKELKDFQDEEEVLMRNPQQNKLRLYMLSGHIIQRQKLIEGIKLVMKENYGISESNNNSSK